MSDRRVTRRCTQINEPDYKYNNLIVDLCKNITDTELNELKERFKDIIPHNVSSPRAMFEELQKSGYIDCHNILLIQQIIRLLGKEDLLETAAKYIRLYEEDEILHYFEKTYHLADGFDIVEFHVVGHKISNRRDLERFRRYVSTILLVPLHEVIVKGVQETSSILITLMLPIMYVEFLKHQLEQNKQYVIESFIRQCVDEALFSTDSFKLKREGTHFLAKQTEILNSKNGQSPQNKSKGPASKPQSQKVYKKRTLHMTYAPSKNGHSLQKKSKRPASKPQSQKVCKKRILHMALAPPIGGMA